jgi:hypothetical protein
VISDLDFTASMGFLAEMLPMQRALTPEALAMAWETLPPGAKSGLTPASLAFAVKQRLLDPQPPNDVALHISLLRYVFPVERTTRRERGEEVNADLVILEHGPRYDLPQRMSQPDRFHDSGPARQTPPAPATAKRLTASGFWHPSMLNPQDLRAHAQKVAQQVERVRAKGDPGTTMTAAQAASGRVLFERALQGFWLLHHDNIAALWVLRNRKCADELIQLALAGNTPAPPPGEAVVAQLVGGPSQW